MKSGESTPPVTYSVEVVAFDAAQLAMTRGLPLLFVGEDFAQTDVRAPTS